MSRMFVSSNAKSLRVNALTAEGKKHTFQFVDGVLHVPEEHYKTIDLAIEYIKNNGAQVPFREVSRKAGEKLVEEHRKKAGQVALKGGMHSLGLLATQAALAARDAELAKVGGLTVAAHEANAEIMLTEQAALDAAVEQQVSQGGQPLATETAETPKPTSPLIFPAKK
jgi:hypothetical protein